ncbi:NrsF family protein [Stutzerimonas stutzeri]|uniref:NrsF family protein n=1 Tax=Stutzerimonas stutzeri TaxID=316 RepID=UPI000310FC3D
MGKFARKASTPPYSLHCPEMSVAFWAVWYVLGMLIPTAVGATLGPRLLRW